MASRPAQDEPRKTLRLPPALRAEIEADALARYPEEACGVLLGERSGGGDGTALVRTVRVESNAHAGDRGRRFAIASERLLAIQREARSAGLEVLGYYHSHPEARAVPSERDLDAAWPETSYLILSIGGGGVDEIRSWRLAADGEAFQEEAIEYRSA